MHIAGYSVFPGHNLAQLGRNALFSIAGCLLNHGYRFQTWLLQTGLDREQLVQHTLCTLGCKGDLLGLSVELEVLIPSQTKEIERSIRLGILTLGQLGHQLAADRLWLQDAVVHHHFHDVGT